MQPVGPLALYITRETRADLAPPKHEAVQGTYWVHLRVHDGAKLRKSFGPSVPQVRLGLAAKSLQHMECTPVVERGSTVAFVNTVDRVGYGERAIAHNGAKTNPCRVAEPPDDRGNGSSVPKSSQLMIIVWKK